MLGSMELRTTAGTVVDVAPDEILKAAAFISQSRRKTHGGPTKTFRCPRCNRPIRGAAMLKAHVAICEAPPVTPFLADQLERWEPDA